MTIFNPSTIHVLIKSSENSRDVRVPVPSGKSRRSEKEDENDEKNPFVIPKDADMFKMQDDEVKRQAQFRRDQRNLKGTKAG